MKRGYRTINRVGYVVGMLKVLSFSRNEERFWKCKNRNVKIPVWVVKCECSTEFEMNSKLLMSNFRHHCGKLECKRIWQRRRFEVKLTKLKEKYEK